MTLPTCTRCHRPLTSPVWSDAGAPYGLTCARRMGLVRDAQRRDPAAGGVRVRATRATRADERQAALPFVPSPCGIYTVARCVERAAFPEGPREPLGDNGTDSHAVIRGLRDYGVRPMRAPTRDGRYSDAERATINAEPSLTDLEVADRTRMVGAYRIAGSQSERVELVRACIAARIPVVIESFVDSAYMDLGPGVVADVPDEHDKHGGGHCEVILAYRTRPDGGTEFLVRGSWGTAWATEGSVWSTEARIGHAWALYAVDVRRA